MREWGDTMDKRTKKKLIIALLVIAALMALWFFWLKPALINYIMRHISSPQIPSELM